jgi:DNA repair protein RadA
LRKSGENRIEKMIDSPYHPYSEVRFTINEKGTDNIDEGKKSKKE